MPAGKFNTSILEAEARTFNTSILADEVDMTPEDTARAQVQFEEEKPDFSPFRIVGKNWGLLKQSAGDIMRAVSLDLEKLNQWPEYARPEYMLRTSVERMNVRSEVARMMSEGMDGELAHKTAITNEIKKRRDDSYAILDAMEKSPEKKDAFGAMLRRIADSRALQLDPEYERSSGLIEDVLTMPGQMALSLGANIVLPGSGLPVMYEQIKGNTYQRLAEDVGDERAYQLASFNAIAQTPLEFLGEMFIIKKMLAGGRPWSKLVADIARSAGVEGLTEFAQQYPDELVTFWAANPDVSLEESARHLMSGEVLKNAAYAGLVGALSGGLLTGAGHGAKRALDRYVLEPQRKKNEEKLNLTLGAVKKLKEGQALSSEEQQVMEGLGALPQAFVDRLYYQTPVDTENRDRVYDGLLKSNITKEQADATITVIDAIAHHYAEATGQTPEAFYDVELTDYRVMPYDQFNVDQERAAAQTRTQFQGGPEDLQIDPSLLTSDVLNRMNKTLKSMGYDVRGGDDIRELLNGSMLKEGKLWHPDWITAYEKAISGVEKVNTKREKKAQFKNINRSRLRELGYTHDLREAGYITPDGRLVDLSGKKEGGPPGHRSYDHREAGGTKGMQEFQAEGNIRMDLNSGLIDVVSLPTSKQLRMLEEIIRRNNGYITVDLWDGLGQEKDSYYYEPERTFKNEYKEGTKPAKILNDIKAFYAGETPHRALFQTAADKTPLGATTFTRFGAIINAFEGNNVSTPIHEVGHVLVDLISRYDPESFAILCKYLGKDPAKGIGSWTTADHEKLAKAFETYMMQGKAPSFRLVTTFRKMKTWLLELYRRVTKLGVKVTPEVRSVFDKWLTTEDEKALDEMSDITNLMDEQSPYYEELKKLRPDAIEQYEDLAAKAQAIVHDKGRQKRLIQINKARAQMRKHAEEIIDDMPYYQDIKTLRYLGRFSEDVIRRLRNYGEDHLQVFREKGVMAKNGKINPDAFVAEQVYVFGREYETAEEFLDLVLEMPTRKNAIEQKYEELEADFWESVEADGLVLDDASSVINAEIELLYAMLGKSPVRAKLLSREISKREELSGEDVRELKKLAADLERTAREAFDQGMTEQKGAQREAEAELKDKQKGEIKALKEKQKGKLDEMRAKNIEKVIALKEKQKDAIKRLREQNRVGAEKKKILARMKKHIRRQGMLYENRQQLQALLARYFKVGKYIPDDTLPTLQGFFEAKIDPETQAGEVVQGILEDLPDPRRDAAGEVIARNKSGGAKGSPWALADLETIAQVADMIIALDASERSNTTEVVKQERANLVDHIYAMADMKPSFLPDGQIKVRQAESWMDRVRESGADLYASLRRIEFFCNFLDGFEKTGLAWARIFKPTADAENHELRLHEAYDTKIAAIMNQFISDASWFKQEHDFFGLGGMKNKLSRQNAFMIALNSGNEHNLNYLREGNRVPQQTIDYIWDEFLTEQEKKAVHEIWALFDTLYPMLNDINKAILGAPLKKVEGHYFPIKTDYKDPERGHIARKREDEQLAKDTGFGPHSFAYPEHGFRKERSEGMKEFPSLLLEASVITTHLDRTIHDISHTLPLLEVYRLIRDPEVMKAIKDVAGENMYDQLTPWLRSISRPVSEPLAWQERVSRHLRKNTSIVGMGFKLTVAAQQPFDLFSTWYELGLKPTAKGIGHFFGGGFIRKVKAIDEASIMMRHRPQAYDREVADFKRKLLDRGGTWRSLHDYYFAFCGAMDDLVAYPTWQAAFDEASQKYLLPDGSVDEEKAIDFADSTVRRVLGAGRAKDLPNAMKGSEMKKFWTMFYTWANKFENQMMELQAKTGRRGLTDPKMIAELMKAALLLVVIPAYLSMFLYKRRLPEDEEWATWLLAYRCQGIPIVRDLAGFMSGYEMRMPLSDAYKSLVSVGKDFGKVKGWIVDDEDLDAYKIAKHVGTAAGYIVGLPTAQAFVTIDGALDLMSGKSDNPLDLLFRAPKDKKKDEEYY